MAISEAFARVSAADAPRGDELPDDDKPPWARWNTVGQRYTVGVEEEVMLLDPLSHALAPLSGKVLRRLLHALSGHSSPETHAAVLELNTGVHPDVGGAAAELSILRGALCTELEALGLTAACAGTHPLARAGDTEISSARRYRLVARSMRALAHREPTMALHVHVGVPDPDDAVRLLNGLRRTLPLLLALSANSPFSGGRDRGFASSRSMIFHGFPRTGAPRQFAGYDDYVHAVDALIAPGMLPDPTFFWWDLRLQPTLGTVEVRVMDAQSTVGSTEPLIALVQSLARLELEDRPLSGGIAPEILAENRFLAARDGVDARILEPASHRLMPVRALIDGLLEWCHPHAAALGCVDQLDRVRVLAAANGADQQRRWARDCGQLEGVVSRLADGFVPQDARLRDRLAIARERKD